MKIKTVKDLKKIINSLDDDFKIELRVRRKLTDDELNPNYPYPCITDYEQVLELDDIGYSDRKLCIGVEINPDNLYLINKP